MSQAICFYCGLPAKWVCDHPRASTNPQAVCGRLLCNGCRRVMDRGTDYCLKAHAPEAPKEPGTCG